MLFNSLIFGLFFPIVFAIYWGLNKKKLIYQNLFIVITSYLFYGWWDWRFLFLISISSIADYIIGGEIYKRNKKKDKRRLLILSLSINLGLLAFFKYFNFFIDSFKELIESFGGHPNLVPWDIILSVGISFYTFQTLSYTLDIYREKLKPEKSIITFFAFVSFFPQLVAGPIERASHLLPQFNKRRVFSSVEAKDGLRLALWGFFKKVVIADNASVIVNSIFENQEHLSGGTLLLGAFLFAFQIYGDFSGYSDMAIGFSKLLGFDLMQNFRYPYLSQNISDFWSRWHISLSTWFRDYLYIPLGGNRVSTRRFYVNIVITFLVSGFWHGANWTFIAWGGLHGVYYIPYHLLGWKEASRIEQGKSLVENYLKPFFTWSITMTLVVLAWVFFRAESLVEALKYLQGIISRPLLHFQDDDIVWRVIQNQQVILFITILMLFEFIQRRKRHVLQINNLPVALRWGIYYIVTIVIILFGRFEQMDFIYFQF